MVKWLMPAILLAVSMTRPFTVAQIRERERRFTFRHPIVMALLTQVSFWIVANSLFVLLIVMFLTAISHHVPGLHVVPLRIAWPGGVLLGITYGTILGCIDLLLERSRDP